MALLRCASENQVAGIGLRCTTVPPTVLLENGSFEAKKKNETRPPHGFPVTPPVPDLVRLVLVR